MAHSEDNFLLSTEKSCRGNVTEVGLSNSFNRENLSEKSEHLSEPDRKRTISEFSP